MKVTILIHTKSGNTEKVAKDIREGMLKVPGIEAKVMHIDKIDKSYINESKSVIFGTPTYYANMSWEMKRWFDESGEYNLEGKLGAVFSTCDYIGGGGDTAILTIINHLMVKGMLVYSGGSALGHPYIHLGHVSLKDGTNEQRDNSKIFGERIAKKVIELFEK